MDQKTIQRLVALRQHHGYSQERLALELGVSRQAISNWERGETAPDTDNLIALAKLYGTGLDALLGLDNDRPTTSAEDGRDHGAVDEKSCTPKASADAAAAPAHPPTTRKHRIAFAAALLIALALIGVNVASIGAWLRFPDGAPSVPQHYEVFGEIVDAEPTYLGVQYVVRGGAIRGRETMTTKPVALSLLGEVTEDTATMDALYTVFVSNEDTQFLSERGKKIDNDFLSLKKGVSATFTLDVVSDTLPALAKADTVRIYDAVGTSLGYVPECNTTI